jgi:type I restriction enzyme S subunit
MELKKGYKQTELGIIPENWGVKNLGELGEVKMCKRIFSYQTKTQGDIPFFKIGTFGKEPDSFITNELYNNYRQRFSFPQKGTLLISAAGTIGRTIVYNGQPSYFQDSNIVWIENDEKKISNSLLFHILQTVNYNTEGGTIQRLYNSILKSTKFIYPAKDEQNAISTALSNIDDLLSQIEKLIVKKKAIKQGVMQELLKPKEGWVTKKLDDVAIFRRGSFPQPYGLEKWYDDISGKPFVQVYDVDDNKKLKIETKRYISSEAQQMSVFAKKGTIVLTIQGSIGRIAITQYEAYIDRTLLIFESYKYDFDKYFFMHTIHQLFELEKQNAPGGIIKTITKEALRNFKISYPNFEEQKNIGITIFDLENEIVIIESKLHKLKLQKQGMMQALLTGKIRLL